MALLLENCVRLLSDDLLQANHPPETWHLPQA
jgi:hypothetical protein